MVIANEKIKIIRNMSVVVLIVVGFSFWFGNKINKLSEADQRGDFLEQQANDQEIHIKGGMPVSVSVESDANIGSNVSGAAIDQMVMIVRDHGYRCNSVTSAQIMYDAHLSCDNAEENYDFGLKGGHAYLKGE